MKWLDANLHPLLDARILLEDMDRAFDLDYSVGAQMDVTGDIVGRERTLSFDPEDGSSPVLDDEMYRMLQRAKIIMNQWDGTIPGAMELWDNLFPHYGLVIQDNQDMTMELIITGTTTPLERELIIRGYLGPKAMGVWIRFNFVMELIRFANMNRFIFRSFMISAFRFANITRPRYIWNGDLTFDGEHTWGVSRHHGINFVRLIIHINFENSTFPVALWDGEYIFNGSIRYNNVTKRPSMYGMTVRVTGARVQNSVGSATGFVD